MYKSNISLTNPRGTAFAISNKFKDTFLLQDAVIKCRGAKSLCTTVNKFASYDKWVVDSDTEVQTRLKTVDTLGNIHYFIAYKQPKETVAKSKLSTISDADLIAELITRGYKVSK